MIWFQSRKRNILRILLGVNQAEDNCDKCSPSKYMDEAGKQECKDCDASETSKDGATICTKCLAGFFMDKTTAPKSCSMCRFLLFFQSFVFAVSSLLYHKNIFIYFPIWHTSTYSWTLFIYCLQNIIVLQEDELKARVNAGYIESRRTKYLERHACDGHVVSVRWHG